MTVKELIKELSKMPEEAECCIRIDYDEYGNGINQLFSVERVVKLHDGAIELEYF